MQGELELGQVIGNENVYLKGVKLTSYPDDKIYERVEEHMEKATTNSEVEALFQTFENVNKVKRRHLDLLDFHMKRTLKK